MTGEEMYEIWAPRDATWSPWVKPVLFAERMPQSAAPAGETPPWRGANVGWAPPPEENSALVVDLLGVESMIVGIALVERGYRPVPLYNACSGAEAVVPLDGLLGAIDPATRFLQEFAPPAGAPPAFLLDSRRQTEIVPAAAGRFDNRWLTFPQDFPSARFLLSQGVRSALLVQEGRNQPADDLAHVLLRWQEGGLELHSLDVSTAAPAHPLLVRRPSRFRSMWYRALAALGLRRNSAGGFGSVIPEPSSG